MLLHLWLSKHCYIPNGCYYCYILFVIMTMNRDCSSGLKCLYLLLYSTSEDVVYSTKSCESCILPNRYQTTTDFSKELLLPGLLKKKKSLVCFWLKCGILTKLFCERSVCFLWTCCWSFEMRKIWKRQIWGLAKVLVFQIFYKKVQVLLWERQLKIWSVLFAL